MSGNFILHTVDNERIKYESIKALESALLLEAKETGEEHQWSRKVSIDINGYNYTFTAHYDSTKHRFFCLMRQTINALEIEINKNKSEELLNALAYVKSVWILPDKEIVNCHPDEDKEYEPMSDILTNDVEKYTCYLPELNTTQKIERLDFNDLEELEFCLNEFINKYGDGKVTVKIPVNPPPEYSKTVFPSLLIDVYLEKRKEGIDLKVAILDALKRQHSNAKQLKLASRIKELSELINIFEERWFSNPLTVIELPNLELSKIFKFKSFYSYNGKPDDFYRIPALSLPNKWLDDYPDVKYAVIKADGHVLYDYYQGGSVNPPHFETFSRIEKLEYNINHRRRLFNDVPMTQKEFSKYNSLCDEFIFTLPSGTKLLSSIDLRGRKEDVKIKEFIVHDLQKLIDLLNKDKKNKSDKGLWCSRDSIQAYIQSIEKELKACNDAWFVPKHSYHIIYDTQPKFEYQQSYKSYVDSLVKQDRYTEIKSFDNWKEAINELLGIN